MKGKMSFFSFFGFFSFRQKNKTEKLTQPWSSARSAARNSKPPYRPLSAETRRRWPPGSHGGDAALLLLLLLLLLLFGEVGVRMNSEREEEKKTEKKNFICPLPCHHPTSPAPPSSLILAASA